MKKLITGSLIIISLSIFIGLISSTYWHGIILFVILGIGWLIAWSQIYAHGVKPLARKLLEQEHPNKADLDKYIGILEASNDEEARDLIRRLIAKRDELA